MAVDKPLPDFPAPPRTGDPALDQWMTELVETLRARPRTSVISTTDGPNDSGETGTTGDRLVDVGSSTTTRYYINVSGTTSSWSGII